ncbi:MAG: hypothetical protein ACMUIM_11990, partial [bacterium]
MSLSILNRKKFPQCNVNNRIRKTSVLGVRLSVPKGAVALLIVFVAAGIVITVALPNLGRDSAGIVAIGEDVEFRIENIQNDTNQIEPPYFTGEGLKNCNAENTTCTVETDRFG